MLPFDVVGVGLNATDTLILLPHFPPYAGKVSFAEELLSPGGPVASAMVACARLGLRAKYVGTLGDDERGRIQLESLLAAGVNIDHVLVRPDCASQTGYVLIDGSTGERTIAWRRPEGLRLEPDELDPEWVTSGRLLHVDGHDAGAVARAAAIARRAAIPVTMDAGSVRDGVGDVLPSVDYLIGSTEFPANWTGETDPFAALARIQKEYGMRVAAMTLGEYGALALSAGRFVYSPGFIVDCVDTTGAGDVFHGAFCYAVLQDLPLAEALDFSNALAALNCTAFGARGGIRDASQARILMGGGRRRIHPDYLAYWAG